MGDLPRGGPVSSTSDFPPLWTKSNMAHLKTTVVAHNTDGKKTTLNTRDKDSLTGELKT